MTTLAFMLNEKNERPLIFRIHNGPQHRDRAQRCHYFNADDAGIDASQYPVAGRTSVYTYCDQRRAPGRCFGDFARHKTTHRRNSVRAGQKTPHVLRRRDQQRQSYTNGFLAQN